jgi:hypothetical protein
VTTSRAGLLIIRAWAESGSSSPLRAQIRLTRDVAHGFERSLTVAEVEAVIATVQAWLSEVLAVSLPVEDDPGPLRRGRLAVSSLSRYVPLTPWRSQAGAPRSVPSCCRGPAFPEGGNSDAC